MDIKNIIGVVSGIIAFSSYFFYIPSIIRGKTKPNRASWWIWSLVGILIVISYYFSGARVTIWVPLSEALGPLLVALLSIKYGEGGWTRFDRGCLLGAGLGSLLWWASGSPIVGLVSYLVIDVMAVMPTIRKSFHRPENESKVAWGLTFAGQFLNIFAAKRLVFSILLYPIYMIITNGLIFALLFFKKGGQAFSSIDIVGQCLSDIPRTSTFQRAISNTVKNGDGVLDIGTGSAILSMFAAKSGAQKVISLEFDPFIREAAEKVVAANKYQNKIEIKLADARSYEIEPGFKPDVVMMEMLTTGMIDEHQVEAINNLHQRGTLSKNTVFLPCKQDTFATVGNFDFNHYGFNIPFIIHSWKFYSPEMKKFIPSSDKVPINSIDFSETTPLNFKATLEIEIKKNSEINCVYLSSKTHLTKDIILDDTDSLNGPVVIPVPKISATAGQIVELDISYIFGGGFENLKVNLTLK